MKEQGRQVIVVPTEDPHGSEYVPAHWKTREWLTGFTGSAGTAVVTQEEAYLWTDSRYWLAAEEQLEGSGFALKKDLEDETIDEWLQQRLSQLPSTQHAVLYMRQVEHRSSVEISRLLGVSEASVRTLLSRARRKLLEEIKKRNQSPL